VNAEELFRCWAPEESVWSRWAKPVGFLEGAVAGTFPAAPSGGPDARPVDVSGVPGPDARVAIVVNLPGGAAVATGVALAHGGYRPIPLFNGVPNTAVGPDLPAAVDTGALRRALRAHAGTVAGLGLLPDAPPAFLIDKYRLAGGAQPSPGTFDNRWVVLAQDFPSGVFLASHGIRGVLLLEPAGWLDGDLAHVLRRWQEAGLPLERLDPASPSRVPLDVPRPSRFRALLYRTGVLFGLRRNAAGGFGAKVPVPSQGGGFHGGFG